MKNILVILSFIFLTTLITKAADNKIISTKPEPLPEKEFTFPSYKEFTLKNGLKVFVIEDHEQPTITLQLLVGGGSSMDGKKSGIAEMMAQLLTKGTKKYDALELAQKLDGVGASIDVSANVDYITVSAFSLTKHFNLLLDAFSEVILKPKFPGKEFDKLVPKILAGIEEEKASPGKIASNLAKKVIYGDDNPYSMHPTEESIKQISNSDVEDFYNTFFKPNNATLAVVGDVKPNDIIAKLEKALNTWKKGDVPKIKIPAPKPQPIGVYFVERPASVQSSILMGTLTVPINNSDYDALDLASSVIGAGFAGRLFRTLREKYSYTYTPFGYITSHKYLNLFACGADVRNSVTDSAISVIKEQLNLLSTMVPDDKELNRVKSFEVGKYQMSFENSDFIADLVQLADFNGIPIDKVKKYPETIMNMLPLDIKIIASKYMNPESIYIIVVGSKDVRSKLEQFGKIYDYDLDLNPLSGEKAKMEPVSIDAKELIQKYTEAIGGKDSLAKILTLADTAKVSITVRGMNFNGKAIEIRKAPGKKYMLFDIGFQKQTTYVDGKSGWISSNGELSEKKDKELDDLLFDATLFNTTKLLDMGYECKVLGLQNNFILMRVKSKSGKEDTYYFNPETYLVSKIESTEDTPQGPVPSTIEFNGYVTLNGIKLPKEIKSTNPIFSSKFDVEYTINPPVDDSIFVPKK